MTDKKFVQRCSPGALVTRDRDKHVGMIVVAHTPLSENASGWRFEILIDNVLITTESFGSQFSLVQTW
jgi:hypothetical protein